MFQSKCGAWRTWASEKMAAHVGEACGEREGLQLSQLQARPAASRDVWAQQARGFRSQCRTCLRYRAKTLPAGSTSAGSTWSQSCWYECREAKGGTTRLLRATANRRILLSKHETQSTRPCLQPLDATQVVRVNHLSTRHLLLHRPECYQGQAAVVSSDVPLSRARREYQWKAGSDCRSVGTTVQFDLSLGSPPHKVWRVLRSPHHSAYVQWYCRPGSSCSPHAALRSQWSLEW